MKVSILAGALMALLPLAAQADSGGVSVGHPVDGSFPMHAGPKLPSWSGPYLGVTGGATIADGSFSARYGRRSVSGRARQAFPMATVFGGATVRQGPAVLGIEADVMGLKIGDNFSMGWGVSVITGIAHGQMMGYLKGGYFGAPRVHTWRAGAGVDFAIADSGPGDLIVRLEYTYAPLGQASTNVGAVSVSGGIDIHNIAAGIGYRF